MFKWDRSHSEVGDTLRYFNSVSSRSTELLPLFQSQERNLSLGAELVVLDQAEDGHRGQRKRSDRLSISSALAACNRPQLSLSSTSEFSHNDRNESGVGVSGSISIVLHPPEDDDFVDAYIDDQKVFVKGLNRILNKSNQSEEDIECIWSAPELRHLFQDASVSESDIDDAGRRKDSSRSSRHHASDGQVVPLRRLMPCMKSQTFDQDGDEDNVDDANDDIQRLRLSDETLAQTHRSILARTRHKYLTLNTISCTEKLFTAALITITLVAIIALFWYQNFGEGFQLQSSMH